MVYYPDVPDKRGIELRSVFDNFYVKSAGSTYASDSWRPIRQRRYDPSPNPAIHPHQRSIGRCNMSSDLASDRRRSTRVRLKVAIEAQGIAESLKCEGETEVVNLHGAFISTVIPLRVGMTSAITQNRPIVIT